MELKGAMEGLAQSIIVSWRNLWSLCTFWIKICNTGVYCRGSLYTRMWVNIYNDSVILLVFNKVGMPFKCSH